MDLIDKYLGEELNEVSGRGMAYKVDVPKKDQKKVIDLFKKMNIKFSIGEKGNIYIGDDDVDHAQEWVARKLNILI